MRNLPKPAFKHKTIVAALTVTATLLALLGLLAVSPSSATAQSAEPAVSARVATPGLQDLEVAGTGFDPGLAVFILPCPGVANVEDATGDNCDTSDTSDLTPATVGRNGTFSETVGWFVPPEGLVFAVGDAALTNFAASRVVVADRNPVNGECRVIPAAFGVALSWFPVADAVEYVYRIDYADKVRYDRVTGDFATVVVESGQNVSVSLSAVFADGSYSAAQDCGNVTTNDDGTNSACTPAAGSGFISVNVPRIDDAVEYVWALKVNGGPISYDRVDVDVPGIAFNIGSGATGSVRISAVFADGTYSDNVQCASIEAE